MESIKLVETDKEILACYAVLQQLHESLREDNIISHVCRLESNGCKLVFLLHSAIVKSLAGFFISDSFSWRKYRYVDDLVSDSQYRSAGYGAKLLE